MWCIDDYVVDIIRVRQFLPSRVVCMCRGGLSHLNSWHSFFFADILYPRSFINFATSKYLYNVFYTHQVLVHAHRSTILGFIEGTRVFTSKYWYRNITTLTYQSLLFSFISVSSFEISSSVSIGNFKIGNKTVCSA